MLIENVVGEEQSLVEQGFEGRRRCRVGASFYLGKGRILSRISPYEGPRLHFRLL